MLRPASWGASVTWRAFLPAQAVGIIAIDFLTVETVCRKTLYQDHQDADSGAERQRGR